MFDVRHLIGVWYFLPTIFACESVAIEWEVCKRLMRCDSLPSSIKLLASTLNPQTWLKPVLYITLGCDRV